MTDWVAVAVVAEVAVAPVVVASAFEIVAAVFVVAAEESCSDWLRNIGQPAVVEHSTAGFG